MAITDEFLSTFSWSNLSIPWNTYAKYSKPSYDLSSLTVISYLKIADSSIPVRVVSNNIGHKTVWNVCKQSQLINISLVQFCKKQKDKAKKTWNVINYRRTWKKKKDYTLREYTEEVNKTVKFVMDLGLDVTIDSFFIMISGCVLFCINSVKTRWFLGKVNFFKHLV